VLLLIGGTGLAAVVEIWLFTCGGGVTD